MKKHAASHGLSVLACTIASALLIDIIRLYIPIVNLFLYDMSARILHVTGLPFSSAGFSLILLASILAVIWGMAFAKMYQKNL
jgi:hypothetical protein